MRPISNEPCGKVRHDGIAVVAELLDDVERVLDPSFLRRHGHRQRELLRNVLDDRVDDAAERDHLVAWVLQELHHATGCQRLGQRASVHTSESGNHAFWRAIHSTSSASTESPKGWLLVLGERLLPHLRCSHRGVTHLGSHCSKLKLSETAER